jgi:hypothetical protein
MAGINQNLSEKNGRFSGTCSSNNPLVFYKGDGGMRYVVLNHRKNVNLNPILLSVSLNFQSIGFPFSVFVINKINLNFKFSFFFKIQSILNPSP